ncbi:MAG: hypothetical protein NC340_04435 [Ruminococcus flavefaciens]|nr:hypothetical protein [Ruminococcus flavefaciens]MCM1229088.1 hypothetical protein [Ruminococcus flavefaciens]
MKHNVIFAVLTVLILVFGFFAMDIMQFFSPEEVPRNISRDDSNAIYLSTQRDIIQPMSIITPSDKAIPEIQRYAAAGMVKAMSRNSNTTYIAWGIDIPNLDEAWKSGGKNYIYVEKWRYMNYGRQEERLLDCIVDTVNYNIVYIRFYSDKEYDVSANEMNYALDKFDAESIAFYTNVDSIANWIGDNVYDEERETDSPILPGIISGMFITDPTVYYVTSYKYFNEQVLNITDLRLASFWLSPLGINNYAYHINALGDIELVYPTSAVLEELSAHSPSWINPSYSAVNGRIYQTITMNNRKLTVIYCVEEDIIEGYYFET